MTAAGYLFRVMCRLNLQEKTYQQAQENSSHGDLGADVQQEQSAESKGGGKEKKSRIADPDCGSFLLPVYVWSYRHSPPCVLM